MEREILVPVPRDNANLVFVQTLTDAIISIADIG
jgi:hypothetical protein